MSRFMLFAALGLALGAGAAEIAGVPRDSNFNNTGGYDSTRIEAQLLIDVDKETDTIHFIRDNNDPRVVTKTYLLKNVDAYEFRDYLRQMVQSKRVGNATLQQVYPGNTTTPPVRATVSAPQLTSATAQPGYSPPVQLGSNTAVECLKFADGTGLLLVSAADYRFRDQKNGIGIDTLVATLDDPAMGGLSYGCQMFIYMPKFVPARNLKPLIENLGMNINDVTELWQGADVVAYDPDLNWLIFDVSNYSCANIAKMLARFDVPIPQVRLKIKVYELASENDDRIGLDFQSWKNNEGVDFFSIGGRYRDNWAAAYGGGWGRRFGSERTSYFNFNPKWNTRYIDLLAAKGRARVVHSGELLVRNNTSAKFSRTTQIFYIDASQAATGSQSTPDQGVGFYKWLSDVVDRVFARGDDLAVGKGNQQITTKSAGYGFTMLVGNASVNLDETRFNVTLNNSSLLGVQSNGTPRISGGNAVELEVSLPHGKDSFVIGGLRKQEVVRSKTGIPWLCEIPILEYVFGSVSTSVKDSELIVVAQCEWDSPDDRPEIRNTSLNRQR
ncbi:MAG: hypothetical protein IJJ28_08200 [Lentisphaeria bacterium]|nr:hypothetical protein [Lentisphaeria bacterium]